MKKNLKKSYPRANNPVEHTAPKINKLICPSFTVKLKLNKTWKISFRSKLLELCKTRTKKSSPDMFNFYVDLAGYGKVSDAGKDTACRPKFKAPSLQTKGIKK